MKFPQDQTIGHQYCLPCYTLELLAAPFCQAYIQMLIVCRQWHAYPAAGNMGLDLCPAGLCMVFHNLLLLGCWQWPLYCFHPHAYKRINMCASDKGHQAPSPADAPKQPRYKPAHTAHAATLPQQHGAVTIFCARRRASWLQMVCSNGKSMLWFKAVSTAGKILPHPLHVIELHNKLQRMPVATGRHVTCQ